MSIGNYLLMTGINANPYQRNMQGLTFYKKLVEDLLDDTTIPPISVIYPEIDIDFEEGLSTDKKFIILDIN